MTFSNFVLDEEFTQAVRTELKPTPMINAADLELLAMVREYNDDQRGSADSGIHPLGTATLYAGGKLIGDVTSFEIKLA